PLSPPPVAHLPAAPPTSPTNTAPPRAPPPSPTRRSSDPTTPQQADLSLTKTVSNPRPQVGETVTFTVTLTNNGPDTATNVSVTIGRAAGRIFMYATPSQGDYDSIAGVWHVGTVAPATSLTLTIVALVTSPGSHTNRVTVSHSDQFDKDTPNTTASVTTTPEQADLALAKAVSDTTPNVGQTVTFTVTLSNLGPDTATNVSV